MMSGRRTSAITCRLAVSATGKAYGAHRRFKDVAVCRRSCARRRHAPLIVDQQDRAGIVRHDAAGVLQNQIEQLVKVARGTQGLRRVAQGFRQFTLLAFGQFQRACVR